MSFVGADKILWGVFVLLTIGLQLLKPKLPADLLIKNGNNRVMFSISCKQGLWLIPGIGVYVWGMDFLILNAAVKLRLVSTLLILVTFFSAFIVTNLVNQELGKIFTAVGIVLFAGSVVFLA